jgi:hypothetical protein
MLNKTVMCSYEKLSFREIVYLRLFFNVITVTTHSSILKS